MVFDSVRVFSKGKSTINYKWNDNFTIPGRRVYVFEVEGCLVTSPIVLNVTALPPAYPPFYLTDDSTHDNFFALATGAWSGNETWQEGKLLSYWVNEDFWPVENETSVFFAPAKIEIYEIFHHVVDSYTFIMSDIHVFDAFGNQVGDADGAIYVGYPWETIWRKYQLTVSTPGRYIIRLLNFDNTVILAEKEIQVF